MACDLTKAIENAALEYLKRLLYNRIAKLLGKRLALALGTLLGGALIDGPLPIGDIIGLLISIGIGIWTIWDVGKLIKKLVDAWKKNMWDSMLRQLTKQLLKLDPNIMDCLDNKPECCLLVIQKASRILVDYVKSLKPGFKKKNYIKASWNYKDKFKKIRTELTLPLQECCS